MNHCTNNHQLGLYKVDSFDGLKLFIGIVKTNPNSLLLSNE
jgi:hypothetical protein